MAVDAEHRTAVLDELMAGGALLYDDGEVAVIAPPAVDHAVKATAMLAALIALATSLVAVLIIGGGAYDDSGNLAGSISTLMLLVSGTSVLLTALWWRRAITEQSEAQPRVVHRGGDGRVHVLPKDAYDSLGDLRV